MNRTSNNKVTISEEFLDEMVNAITELPFHRAQPIFIRLAQELSDEPDDTPTIVTRGN